jgi:hypothetical protein
MGPTILARHKKGVSIVLVVVLVLVIENYSLVKPVAKRIEDEDDDEDEQKDELSPHLAALE